MKMELILKFENEIRPILFILTSFLAAVMNSIFISRTFFIEWSHCYGVEGGRLTWHLKTILIYIKEI